MESLYNGLHRGGQTLETAATLRLPKRPQAHSNPNPKAFEDFGSSLAPRSSQVPPRLKFKPVVSPKPTRLITIRKPLSDFSESEDELDLLSSSQADPDDFQPSNKVKAGKYLDEKGKEHDYDPNFLPSKSNVLAKIKFTKIKKTGGEDNTTIPSSSSSKNQPHYKENGADFGSWVNSVKNQLADTGDTSMGCTKTRRCSVDDDNVPEVSGPLRVKNRRLSPPRPPPKQSNHRELPNIFIPPRPRPRPLPRPAGKLNADARGSKPSTNVGLTTWPTSQFKSSAINPDGLDLIPLRRPKATTTTKKKSPSPSPSPKVSVSTPTKKVGSGSHPPPQNFPMDMISPLGEKVQQKPLPKSRLKTYGNTANPPSFEASRKFNAFPMPSPQSSDRAGTRVTSQSKGKNKALPFPLDDQDEESDYDTADSDNDKVKAEGRRKSLPKPQGFPMPTQMLASIGSPSVPKGRPSKYQKRMSENLSDDEGQAKKKRRNSLLPGQSIFEDEGDSITIAPDIDPRTLCPYCDTPLPSSPSPLLLKILAATRKKSTRDPRPSNPLGLRAPLAIFIVACQRHRFEGQILPEAESKGWPKTIQWQKLGVRVEMMKDELQALINDPGGERELDDVDEDIDEVERLFRDDDDETKQKGPKARSIFWTEVMDEVKKKGLRAVIGVRGQFANFEKTQPGYYGEQGSVIIHQTLFDMFPPTSFDPARIWPLTSNEFVLRILVPEVALRLIMEDRYLRGNDGMHQALIVLRESSAYGVAMFPEDGGELGTGKQRGDDEMGVGDKIVMERARKRRKELEEEEEEAGRIAEMETEVVTEEVKERKTGSKKRKGKQREDQQLEVQQAPVERPRPRPRPIMKASSGMSILASDSEEVPQLQQPSARLKYSRKRSTCRTQSRTRSMYSGMDTDRSSDFSSRPAIDFNASESDDYDYDRPTSEERRRSPSSSESKLEQTKDKMKKSSSTRATSKGLVGLNIGFDSDASAGSRTSTKSEPRRSSRKKSNAIRRPNSTMDVDLDDGDVDDANLEIENVLDTKTPVHKHSRSSNHLGAEDNERTPKPLMIRIPRAGGSDDIKPLMVARMRQSQKNESGTEADMPRRTSKLRSDERAPNMRATHAEDSIDEQVEVVASPNSYNWLLNDTSQSSVEGSRTTRRRY